MKKILTFIYFFCLPVCFVNAQYWRLTGNSGTVVPTNFVGTLDSVPLMFKVFSQKAGYLDYRPGNSTSFGYKALNIDNGLNNSAFGYQALLSNYLSSNNTAVGYQSLYSNSPYADVGAVSTASNNTGAGFKSLFSNTSGGSNTGIGSQSLFSNTSGKSNTGIGSQSLFTNTKGNYNTAVGAASLYKNSSGVYNTASGYQALYNNTTGSYNIAYGNKALQNNTTGNKNIAIGNSALFSSKTGVGNVAIGDSTLFMYNYVFDEGAPEYNLVAVGRLALTDNTSGYNNTALGALSLVKNTSGGGNTASGVNSLYSNNNGINNTANGLGSLYFNISGSYNTANGESSLYYNTSGNNNTASGESALYSNIAGNSNVAIGIKALYTSRNNSNNIAIGDSALLNYDDYNFSDYVLAVGSKALLNNTTGFYNTAVGALALKTITKGYSNTGLGYNADVNSSGRFNATAIGYNAIATADNQVMLGNASVTSVKAAATYIIMSDGRFKKNLKENVPGLDFIKQLKPVTYNYDVHGLNKFMGAKEERNDARSNMEEEAIAAKEKKLYTGFVAQDVEKVAQKMGYDFSGVYKPQNDKDAYGLSYADFVVPLVKAVQELSKNNDSLKAENEAQKQISSTQQKQIDDLKAMMLQLQQNFNRCNACVQQSAVSSQRSTVISAASIEQNIPNPFSHATTINYTLPSTYSSAKIIVLEKTGKVLKEVNISGNGKGSIQLDASTLTSGAYNYSLYVNGRLIDTKQMERMR